MGNLHKRVYGSMNFENACKIVLQKFVSVNTNLFIVDGFPIPLALEIMQGHSKART
jgi:hypothetical protein